MNKAGLTDQVYEALGGTRADAERAVDAFLNGIVSALQKGEEVSIAGLGIFEVKTLHNATAVTLAPEKLSLFRK